MRIVAFIIAIILALATGGCAYERHSAGDSLQSVFGRLPMTAIVILQADDNLDNRDEQIIHMRVQVNETTLLSLVGKRGSFSSLQGYTYDMGSNLGAWQGMPWWTPLAGHPNIFIESHSLHDPTYTQGRADITYDSASRIAYVYSDMWD